MNENKVKNNLEIIQMDKKQTEETQNLSTTINNNFNNVLKTSFTTKENPDNNPQFFKKKNNSDIYISKNNNSNRTKTINNEYEESNFKKEYTTEREYDNLYKQNSDFSYNQQIKSKTNLSSLIKENSNNNYNNLINKTFTAPNINVGGNFNNMYNSNSYLEFLTKNKYFNFDEIPQVESSKGFLLNSNNNFNLNMKNNLELNKDLQNYDGNIENNNMIFESSIAGELRLSNLERRFENTEKILHFYDEMMRLKDEERRNEIRIDKNIISELNKKVNLLEENIKFLNRKITEQGELFNEKIDLIEKNVLKSIDNNNSIGEFYAGKLAEFENLYKKSESFFETKIEEKSHDLQINMDSKLEDVLNLINELTQQTDKNDFNIIESRETIRNIQNDHVDFLKIVTILKEKADSLDYIMEQITDLKHRYNKIINLYGVQQFGDDDKFFNKINNENNIISNNHYNQQDN